MGQKIVFLDTETGGLNPEENSILSLGAVIYEDGKILDTFYVVVNEGLNLKVEQAALKVNGFTVDFIEKNGWLPFDAWNDFREFLRRNNLNGKITIGGHNVNFDVGFIKRLMRLSGTVISYESIFDHKVIDTMAIAGFLNYAGVIKIKSPTLDNSLKAFNVSREGGVHDAKEDAQLAATLFTKMVGLVQQSRAAYPDIV